MEVAGLVVGIIPLTISALEAYQTMCDAIGVIRNHSEAFRSLHVRLRASFFIYRKAVERMLYPLSLSESELEKCGYLDSEKILLLWYTPKEKEKLESCLGAKQCHMYQGLITMFFERIKTLVVDLKLNKECKPLWIGNDGTVDDLRQYKFIGSYSKWRKVRAGLKDRSFQKQLDAIEEDAKRIQYLVDLDLGAAPDQALRKQAAPNTRRQKTESKYLRSITMAATKFYRLLDSWSAFCPNPCGYTHKASLQISEFLGDPHEATQQTAQLQHGEDHSYTSVHLKTLFLLDRIGAQPTWNWKAVDVEPRLQLQPASTITRCELTSHEMPYTFGTFN
ncbi:hypothetical protein BJ508DRAFT_117873 [Ascobolus immersus RN42]|uniref:Prion-inhibition and propagation HeLo domain-containing protein n=1 Tax=Ascobolus immersus RN42 TaxID=1160509 RepID=A0A3N4I6D2_ASCIM|nr:hypothetical protein BJ508DRAFT_117873 [Ascobolus immersus RN42]